MTLDFEEAKRLRDEAMEQVDINADEAWKFFADAAIECVAFELPLFWSDHVWVVLDDWGVPRPREARAFGPRMAAAVRQGKCEPTGDFQPSQRPELHASPRRVYRSLIWRQQ